MGEVAEHRFVGLDALNVVTTLLQRRRLAHPTRGTFQAAEIQFWWSIPRSTDDAAQLVWLDREGQPVAAVTVTDFGDGSSLVYEEPTLVVLVLPDATDDWVAHVLERGLAHVAGLGIEAVEIEVERNDDAQRRVLFDRGFEVKGAGTVECWLDASVRPAMSRLADGYRIVSRADTAGQPHHLADEGREYIDQRLNELSLYRPDLDLFAVDADGDVAAYGIFWFDPTTETGVVEPMRTHEPHRGRGLARHILTAGADALAQAGAKRIALAYEPDNPVSGPLYRSAGFVPTNQSDVLAGPTTP
ncbi:MAG: GNAT family N-acetyltransferase [Actinomycetota bacterium]